MAVKIMINVSRIKYFKFNNTGSKKNFIRQIRLSNKRGWAT
jgi:hypothetical protein